MSVGIVRRYLGSTIDQPSTMVKYGHPHPQRLVIRGAAIELHSQFQFAAPIRNAYRYYNPAAIILIEYHLAKIQYYTTVCMRHHQPNPSAEHVDAMKNRPWQWPRWVAILFVDAFIYANLAYFFSKKVLKAPLPWIGGKVMIKDEIIIGYAL